MADILDQLDTLISEITHYGDADVKKEEVVQSATPVQAEVIEAGSVDEQMNYITRGLEEIMNEEEALKKIRHIIEVEKRPFKIYWGTATTGAPHIAYFIPLTKLGDFLKAGCNVKILLADLHAFLDAEKTPWELLDARVDYYKAIISSMLRAVNVPLEKLEFIRGSDFQLSKEYTLDMYRLTAKTSVHAAKKAGAEVVKQADNPELAPVIYPLLQSLDEHYLGVDAQFGGVDQRKIFAYASDYLKKVLGYPSRIHMMNPICPGLTGGKMSSSEKNTKIDPLEDAKSVTTKIRKAFCEEGNIEKNGVLSFCKFVIFPCFLDGKPFIIERRDAEAQVFSTYKELEAAFAKREVHPADLKQATTKALNVVLDKVRADFAKPEFQGLRERAYPPKKDQAKSTQMTPEEEWIVAFHRDNGEWPNLKAIRAHFSIPKRPAKRFLQNAQKLSKA